LKASGEGADLGDEAAAPGLKNPPLGVGKALYRDLSQFIEFAFQAREPFVQVPGAPLQGRGALALRLGAPRARLAKKRLLRRLVRSRLVGGDKGLGLVGVEAVSLDRVRERDLPASGEGAQPQRRGQAEAARVQPRLQRGRKLPRELQTTLDPLLSAAESLADRANGTAVLVRIRADHPGLVHGAAGARRRVALKDLLLGGDGRGGFGFDDDRNLAQAFGGPPREPLEPVDDLAGPVFETNDPQGQRRERLRARGTLPAQDREARAELLDRDLLHERHGFPSPLPSSGSN
jgi:hypothetical protein